MSDGAENSPVNPAELPLITRSYFESLIQGDALNKSPGIPCLSQECLLYNNDNQLVLVDQNITFNTLMFNSKS